VSKRKFISFGYNISKTKKQEIDKLVCYIEGGVCMPIPAERVDIKTNRKVLSISSKRQITIPQKFYTALGFGDKAECVMKGGELIIRPVKTVSGGEFAEQILEDLIKEGLSGEALLSEFKERQAQIRPIVESMLYKAGGH
jgi:bifunctional DNA-binding transcriptional regulator/antitoxin component of YhaV-PrlF toxin-antitoxin module